MTPLYSPEEAATLSRRARLYRTVALILAVALPLATWLVTTLMGRVWPVDRAILIMVMFLCSVGLI